MRRPFGQAKIARFLRQIKDDDTFAVWLCHKRFTLLTYFVDLWCETLAYRDGLDLYEDGASLAMSNMTYYCLPAYTSEGFFTSMLRDFQTMMITRTRKSYDRLLWNLAVKYNSSSQDVQEILTPFVGAVHLLGYGHLRSLPENAIDPALPGLAGR